MCAARHVLKRIKHSAAEGQTPNESLIIFLAGQLVACFVCPLWLFSQPAKHFRVDQHNSQSGVSCDRVTAGQLSEVSVSERATLFLRPTLIAGVIGDWPSFDLWLERQKAFFHNQDPELFKVDMSINSQCPQAISGRTSARFQVPRCLPTMQASASTELCPHNGGGGLFSPKSRICMADCSIWPKDRDRVSCTTAPWCGRYSIFRRTVRRCSS